MKHQEGEKNMRILDLKEQIKEERKKNEELREESMRTEAITSYNIMMGNLEDPEEEDDE